MVAYKCRLLRWFFQNVCYRSTAAAGPRAEPSEPSLRPALGSALEQGSLPTSRPTPSARSAHATFRPARLGSARPGPDARRACSALCQPCFRTKNLHFSRLRIMPALLSALRIVLTCRSCSSSVLLKINISSRYTMQNLSIYFRKILFIRR